MALTVSPNHSADKNPFIYEDYRRITGHQWKSLDPTSLPDAKPAKYLTQQIIRREFAGNGIQSLLRQPQFLRE